MRNQENAIEILPMSYVLISVNCFTPMSSSFQQRLSYTTLSDLALRLIDGTVYDIVFHHYNVSLLSSSCPVLKQDLIHKHKEALQVCKSHNLVVMKTNRQGETEALEIEVREEQMMDDKILVEMDQKVINQQNTLEIARVPGFYITTNPQLNQHFVNVHYSAYALSRCALGGSPLCAAHPALA
uniref:DiGeorge syndrome critical region gene 6 n=1 Tax=Salmo trutta TaxID=8032 RepID=A0A674CTM2_SALTR